MTSRPSLLGLVLLGLLAFSLGCAGFLTAPVTPPLAGVFTNIDAPLDTDMEETKLLQKRGEASTYNILGLVAWGDSSIHTAAEEGGIETVHHADYQFLNVLGVYSRFTTVVRGE